MLEKFIKNKYVSLFGYPLIAILTCFALLYPLFKKYFLSPNEFMYAFGGDALTLYYDLAYQTCYGGGIMIKNMNYPDGELVFLTDGQGALSTLFNFINKYLYDICDYALGIMHSLQILSTALACIFIYFIFRKLKIVEWRASIFAGFIAAFAPQISRVIAHHGLSYSFIIPMTILWLLRKFDNNRFEKRDLLVMMVIIFFGFNNSYVAMMTALIILTSVFVKILFERNLSASNIWVGAIGLFPLVLLVSFFKIFDPYDDRLKFQWGFFEFKTNIAGFFMPPNSMMRNVVKSLFGKTYEVKIESLLNLGFPTALILIVGGLLFLVWKKYRLSVEISASFKYIFLGSIIIFLYSSGIIFMPFSENTVETKLGSLLMFKAVGRLSISTWYCLSIMAILAIEPLFKSSNIILKIVLALAMAILWNMDFNGYRKKSFSDHEHTNIFNKDKKLEVINDLKTKNIIPSQYQAILSVPRMIAWHDLFITKNNFFNQFSPMQISMATGLPMVNGMYSRISTSQVQERMEFYSHPLIEKSLHKKFPNQKPILLIHGKPDLKLSVGEQYLIDVSTKLFEDQNLAYYSLDLAKINQDSTLSALKSGEYREMTKCTSCFSNHFDEQKSKVAYAGAGSILVAPKSKPIFEQAIETIEDSKYEFSCWTYIDKNTFGISVIVVTIYDQNNKMTQQIKVSSQDVSDVHNEWSRLSANFEVKDKCKVVVHLESRGNQYIDELTLRPLNRNILYRSNDYILFNGFRVDTK
jgi:hypothetical protein